MLFVSFHSPTFPLSTARPSLPFAQLTRIWTIRHDTSGLRATWEFNMVQIQNGSLSGYCVRINSSSRLDSRPAALLILLIPSPPLWNSLDCRGLVPPKSGVLTLLRSFEGEVSVLAGPKLGLHRYDQSTCEYQHLGFRRKQGLIVLHLDIVEIT